jgi:hypothetical protein
MSKMRGLLRFLLSALLLFAHTATAPAAELDGVAMPDLQDVAGAHLVLNGVALRTYSIIRIRIYVAGLYLEQRSSDATEILRSIQPKLLRFAFLRNVDADTARHSWRAALDRTCVAPCHLSTDSIARFLAAVPSVRQGDISMLLFTAQGMDFLMNGHLMGRVTDPEFANIILATFIGQHPTSEELKAALLGAPR